MIGAMLLVHAAATLVMVGVIWFVQIVHYPLFAAVPVDGFVAYEARHTNRTAWVVGPPMVIEGFTALVLVAAPPDGASSTLPMIGLGLLGLVTPFDRARAGTSPWPVVATLGSRRCRAAGPHQLDPNNRVVSPRSARPHHAGDVFVTATPTVLILGDQLSRYSGALRDRSPSSCRVLFVESTAALKRRRWHRQRAHLVLSAMRHFADELRSAGFDVDYREAPSLEAGIAAHRHDYEPSCIVATQPNSHQAIVRLEKLGIELLRNRLFLTTPDEFVSWAAERKTLRMEDFYRWQRQRLHILMDGAEPAGGRWNFDADNREPPPKDGRDWPPVTEFPLDAIDQRVLADLEAMPEIELWGADPIGWWPVTRAQALVRLREFVDHALPVFGSHEDAMLQSEWKMAHSTLSSSMNLGLLHPSEVVHAAEDAYRRHDLPLNSVEGFIRQIIGWREYVWGVYWLWGPDYLESNELDATAPIPRPSPGMPPPTWCASLTRSNHCTTALHTTTSNDSWCSATWPCRPVSSRGR